MARVMIAEDYEPSRTVLRESLQIGEHEVVAEAIDGIEAVTKFNETKPDVLLLDIAMPKKDGVSALKEILARTPNARIIMLTAKEDLSTIADCVSMGAQAYLIKPYELVDVLNAIKMTLA